MIRNKRTAVPTKDAKQHTGYWFAAVLLFLCFLIPLKAAAEDAPGADAAPGRDFDFKLSSGYCLGGLSWNIAGLGGFPNIRSELTWSELQTLQIEGEGRLTIERFTVHADMGYGLILDGETRDSDYNSDDRTDEFSRSYSDARGGYLLHALTGLGYRWDLGCAPVTLLPMAGIGFHRQAMKMTDGVQVISEPPSTRPLGPISGLDSSYTTNWLNIWVGLDGVYRFTSGVRAGAAVSVHPSLYYAAADWNLRDDLAHPVSFEHRALGFGLCGELSVGIESSRGFLLEGRFAMDYWFGGPGVDETFSDSGGSLEIRLNEVVWSSLQFSLGIVQRL